MLRAILNKSWRQHPTRPASYHENYSSWTNQTCRTLLEKQGWTHKWCTLMDPHTWPCKSRSTSTNIHSANMWRYGMLSRRPAWGDERLGKVAREGQGYPCYQHDMMMMMISVLAKSAFWTRFLLVYMVDIVINFTSLRIRYNKRISMYLWIYTRKISFDVAKKEDFHKLNLWLAFVFFSHSIKPYINLSCVSIKPIYHSPGFFIVILYSLWEPHLTRRFVTVYLLQPQISSPSST